MIKRPFEAYTDTYDFAPKLGTATVASVVSVASAPRGTGANLSEVSHTISGQVVLVKWSGGVDGEDYLTTVRITDSTGDTFEIDGAIEVRASGLSPEPVTLEQAKLNLRVTEDTEDSLIADLIVAAREHVESVTGLVLTRRQVVETRRSFGPWIDLYSWPIASIDSIGYLDSTFAAQTLAPDQWIAGTAMRPVRIVSRGYWPRIAAASAAVTITLTAGYATPDLVPMRVKQAIHLLVTHWFRNREAAKMDAAAGAIELPLGVSALLDGLRVRTV